MSQATPSTAPFVKPPESRLDSWKEIAAPLNRDVTTVQRWERREGMPVHRHLHAKMGSVYAFREELDAWARRRDLQAGKGSGNNALSPDLPALLPQSVILASRFRWKFILPVATVVVASLIGTIFRFQKTEYFWRNPIADARFQPVTNFDGLQQSPDVPPAGQSSP